MVTANTGLQETYLQNLSQLLIMYTNGPVHSAVKGLLLKLKHGVV